MADFRYERYDRGSEGIGWRDGFREEPAPGCVAAGGGEGGAGEDAAEGEDVGGGGNEGCYERVWGGGGVAGGEGSEFG